MDPSERCTAQDALADEWFTVCGEGKLIEKKEGEGKRSMLQMREMSMVARVQMKTKRMSRYGTLDGCQAIVTLQT